EPCFRQPRPDQNRPAAPAERGNQLARLFRLRQVPARELLRGVALSARLRRERRRWAERRRGQLLLAKLVLRELLQLHERTPPAIDVPLAELQAHALPVRLCHQQQLQSG